MTALFDTEKRPMSAEDRARMNDEHVKRQLELETLKEEKRDVSAVYRVKIRELEEKIHTLATQLDAGVFEVSFEVLEVPDDARQMIAIQRKDTGQEINVRPMTEAEKEAARKRRQVEMFAEGTEGDTERPAPLPRTRSKAKKPTGKNGKARR